IFIHAIFGTQTYHCLWGIHGNSRESPNVINSPYIPRAWKQRVCTMPCHGEITRLLGEWSNGNQAALNQLVPIVYDELRRLASIHMRGESPGHLLQTTALA